MKRSREPEEGEGDRHPAAGTPPPSSTAGRPAAPTDPSERAAKIAGLDESAITDDEDDDDDDNNNNSNIMRCSLPPHHRDAPLAFRSYADYEAHYAKAHTNRCVECRRNFPSEHLLGVHIEDIHDAIAAVRREQGEHTYSCFVEGCDRKCRTHQKRRLHLIDKHSYPKNYFFGLTKDGIDGRRSLLVDNGPRRRASSAATPATVASPSSPGRAPVTRAAARRQSLQQQQRSPQSPRGVGARVPSNQAKGATSSESDEDEEDEDEEDEEDEEEDEEDKGRAAKPREKPDVEMSDLTSAMSSLRFVPRHVKFGRGKGKTGFAKS